MWHTQIVSVNKARKLWRNEYGYAENNKNESSLVYFVKLTEDMDEKKKTEVSLWIIFVRWYDGIKEDVCNEWFWKEVKEIENSGWNESG